MSGYAADRKQLLLIGSIKIRRGGAGNEKCICKLFYVLLQYAIVPGICMARYYGRYCRAPEDLSFGYVIDCPGARRAPFSFIWMSVIQASV